MENFSQPNLAYENAARRVKDLKDFYGNLTSYCMVIPFLIIVNFIFSPSHLWFYWPMLGWGIGILFHALKVFGFNKNWEEKKIKKLMEENEVE